MREAETAFSGAGPGVRGGAAHPADERRHRNFLSYRGGAGKEEQQRVAGVSEPKEDRDGRCVE